MKPTKAFLTLCSVLTFLVGGKTACAAAEPRIYLRGTFAPFAMCMANMSIANQVSFAEKVGFTGMGLSGMVKYQVNQAVNLPQVVSGKFKIPSVLWYSNINEPINVPWLDSILDDAKKVDMAVWMVSGGNKNRLDSTKSLAVSRLKVVAERCRAKGVRMVLYPHLGTAFETAEDGMEALDSLRRHGYSEVKLSIHLCHEVKKGNGGRIASIVSKVAPYLAMATVNGADSNTYRLNDGWATAIMPLDAGTYDPKVFLKALSQAKFDGPIELHTYGLKSPVDPAYDGHFERSLARWNEWVTNVPPVEASASPAPLGTDLVAYAICMAGQSIANQVGFAEKAGYTSIGLAGMIQYQLAQAASLPQIATGKVRIRNVRWYSSIRDTLDTVWLDAVLADTRKLGASVWMVSGGNKDKSDATKSIAISKLRRVADRCKVAGVPLVVYPHQGTLFDGVEEGLAALDSLRRWGHPEVGISMDYSHELARGNQLRIPALVAKAAPYLAIATVSGADVDGAGVVKPLDQGTLEIAPYLDALATAGFSGAVQLQTAGLPSPADANYDGHLERSLTRWNRIVAPVVDHRLPIEGGLVPFATCMATQSVASQVEASSKAGYSGIGLAGLIRYQMDQLAVLPQVASGAFRVRSAMWYTSIQDALDTAWLDGVLVAAKKMGTSIWMVSGGNRDKSDATKSVAIAKLHRVADRCRNGGRPCRLPASGNPVRRRGGWVAGPGQFASVGASGGQDIPRSFARIDPRWDGQDPSHGGEGGAVPGHRHDKRCRCGRKDPGSGRGESGCRRLSGGLGENRVQRADSPPYFRSFQSVLGELRQPPRAFVGQVAGMGSACGFECASCAEGGIGLRDAGWEDRCARPLANGIRQGACPCSGRLHDSPVLARWTGDPRCPGIRWSLGFPRSGGR
ncbi:MAG: sugar phosphate isomerase/epimerase [Fibrobacteres bacterium]|nr:sugar phosphate isomerase/epimerase [Fibrobacterota bacterium]